MGGGVRGVPGDAWLLLPHLYVLLRGMLGGGLCEHLRKATLDSINNLLQCNLNLWLALPIVTIHHRQGTVSAGCASQGYPILGVSLGSKPEWVVPEPTLSWGGKGGSELHAAPELSP